MKKMKKEPSVALAMIVKNEQSEISSALRAIRSVEKYVDRVHITLNGASDKIDTPESLRAYSVSYMKWSDDFAAARNFNFKQVNEDWVLWIDADDEVQNPKYIKRLVEDAEDAHISGYWLKYLYDRDERGHVTTWHWKMRLIKNDGHGAWAGRIHEDFLQRRQVNWVRSENVIINHLTNPERREASINRNIAILIDEVKTQGAQVDPRLLFYLGAAYLQMGDAEKALRTYEHYLTVSGWDEERYEAYQQMGEIYYGYGKYDDAKSIYLQSTLELPDYPDAYFSIGDIYQKQGNHEKCIEWMKTGFSKTRRDSMIFQFPQKSIVEPAGVYATSLMELGYLDDAAQVIEEAMRYEPDDDRLIYIRKLINDVRERREVSKAYARIADYLDTHKKQKAITRLLDTVPKDLEDNVLITRTKGEYLPAKVWGKNSVVFFCGKSAEPWSPKSIDRGGIGGSETAVIQIAKRLAKMGKEVTVFNWCNDEDGVYDGVTYKNYWTTNFKDKFNTIIIWRMPQLLEFDIRADKIYVDLHDVPIQEEFTPKRVEQITKILVKSQYHRSLLPNVTDDKILIVPNGIDISRFNDELERDEHSALYSSAPDRGLDILVDLWPRIRKEVPDAKLNIFYGWETYMALNADNPERVQWAQNLKKKVDALGSQGVTYYGRIGQKDLAEWMQKSGIWAYPTYFEEISCITAMEAQASGCIPVTTDYAALSETVQHGVKVRGDIRNAKAQDAWLANAISSMKNGGVNRKKMSEWARMTYSWDTVAKQWNEIINS